MPKAIMKISKLNGQVCLSIGPVGCMLSIDDAEMVGHDLIITAAELRLPEIVEKPGKCKCSSRSFYHGSDLTVCATCNGSVDPADLPQDE